MPRRDRKPSGLPRGRKLGGKNKATLEREELARRELEARENRMVVSENLIVEARRTGRKLAREILDDLMQLGMGMMATFQPLPPAPGSTPETPNANPNYNEDKFWRAAEFTKDCAIALANYQSPKLKAEVQVNVPVERAPQEILPPLPPAGSSKSNVASFREAQYFKMMRRVEG